MPRASVMGFDPDQHIGLQAGSSDRRRSHRPGGDRRPATTRQVLGRNRTGLADELDLDAPSRHRSILRTSICSSVLVRRRPSVRRNVSSPSPRSHRQPVADDGPAGWRSRRYQHFGPGSYVRPLGTLIPNGPKRKVPAPRSSSDPNTLGESNLGGTASRSIPSGATSQHPYGSRTGTHNRRSA